MKRMTSVGGKPSALPLRKPGFTVLPGYKQTAHYFIRHIMQRAANDQISQELATRRKNSRPCMGMCHGPLNRLI